MSVRQRAGQLKLFSVNSFCGIPAIGLMVDALCNFGPLCAMPCRGDYNRASFLCESIMQANNSSGSAPRHLFGLKIAALLLAVVVGVVAYLSLSQN